MAPLRAPPCPRACRSAPLRQRYPSSSASVGTPPARLGTAREGGRTIAAPRTEALVTSPPIGYGVRRADWRSITILKQYYLGCLPHASYLIADKTSGTAAVG